jgi:hypothetical protein
MRRMQPNAIILVMVLALAGHGAAMTRESRTVDSDRARRPARSATAGRNQAMSDSGRRDRFRRDGTKQLEVGG